MHPPRRRDGDDDFIELTPPDGNEFSESASWSFPSDSLLLTPAPFVLPPDDPADGRGPFVRAGRWLVLALPVVLLAIGLGAYFALLFGPTPRDAPEGRLVVLLAFDFLPGDKMTAWSGLYGPDGFERMKAQGVWYPEVEVPQAFTAAGPGFANLVTGAPPNGHGVTDDTPAEPLATTVGDVLKSRGVGKVVAVGLDDRALCLGGKSADAVVGFDTPSGVFRAVGRPDPEWVATLNARKPADRWAGKSWERLLPVSAYESVAGSDNPVGKGGGVSQGLVFPHPFGPPGIPGPDYRAAVGGAPAGNELAWEAARAAIDGEQLGQRGQTDLLCVALTAGGGVLRSWGPEGHEAADYLARADRLVAEVLAALTATVGPDRWALVVAGCHGGCPLPEAHQPGRPAGERYDPAAEFGRLGEAMDASFGVVGKQPGKWVDRIAYPWVDLNRKTLADRKVNPADAAAFAAQWLGNRSAAQAAYPRGGPYPDDPLGKAVAATFHDTRGGDVFLVHRPYAIPAAVGAAAGSPYPYDRGVTLLAVGHGVPARKPRPGRISQTAAAAVLAKVAGVAPPVGAEPLPEGWE